MVSRFLGRLVLEKGLDVFSDAIDAARAMDVPLKVRGDRRRSGTRLFRGAAARRDLHRPVDRRRAGRPRWPRPTSSSIRRSPRPSATSRWKRWPAGLPVIAAAASGDDQPGAGRRHRAAWPSRRHRGFGRCAGGLSARSRPAREAWRGRAGVRQDDGLGRDQRRRDARLRTRHRTAAALPGPSRLCPWRP